MAKRQSGKSAVTIVLMAGLVLIPVLVQAGSLTGTVTDQSDGSALFKATVTVKSNDVSFDPTGNVADENGEYTVKNIPTGEYTVIVSSIGFTTQSISGIKIDESGSSTLNVALEPTFINLDAISVTASRRPEKINEAPAAVSVVSAEEIESRAALTPTEHVKGLPSVDVASTGLNQSTAVVRGFNNIFSGAMLVLADNRIARVPSLRFNAYNFIPTINEDIERIEMVSGPGSALYGPNAASGVMHMLTKSPFSSQGTTITVGGGERNLFLGAFRHAGVVGQHVGYKITGQYYQGDDWKSYEPSEPDSIILFRPTAAGPKTIGDYFPNERNYDIEKISGEGRVDFLLTDDMTLILNGGMTQANSLELTGLGAGRAIDWMYYFGQMRLNYKDLFIQSYVNGSDAGDTYLYPTGQLIIDKSKLWVGQIQHRYSPRSGLAFTYGFDALLTRPNTEYTINGSNEEDDNIDELGAYIQTDVQVTDQLKLVGAARVDDHNRLEDMVFSPRAAAVFQPEKNHTFRLTYNRAFSTPDNNNFYLDILQTDDLGDMGDKFSAAFGGYRPEIDIRVQGVPESGFHWKYSDDGDIMFRSPFAPPLTLGMMSTEDFIELNDPLFTGLMWQAGRGAVIAGFEQQLAQFGVPQGTIDLLSTSLEAVTPGTVSGVQNALMTINPDKGVAEPSTLDDIADIGRLEPTITQTIELGYNGLIADKFKFSIDVYRTEKNNFIGPLTVETPNVFLDPGTLWLYLESALDSSLNDPANAFNAAVLDTLDSPIFGGDDDGTVADELTAMFTEGAASIPFGTVTPEEALDPTAVLVTYRNFGDISFYGADLSLAYRLNHSWSFGGSYSYISKNFFEKSDEQVHDIHLNAPKHKFALFAQYRNPKLGLDTHARMRFVDAFKMISPFYGDEVKAYEVLDLNVGLEFFYGTYLALTVQNLLDNKHIEFVGGPELGRLAIMRLTKSF